MKMANVKANTTQNSLTSISVRHSIAMNTKNLLLLLVK